MGIEELKRFSSKRPVFRRYSIFPAFTINKAGFPLCPDNIQYSIRSGFTLLELLISLTIIGLILVLVFSALRIGSRAWMKGEKDVEIHQRQRVVLNNIKRQIASTCLREIKGTEAGPTTKKVFFRGDSESMEFMSRVPMVPTTRSGIVYVKYVVSEENTGEKKRLLLYEKDVVLMDKEEGIGDPDEADFYELIPGAEGIAFEYLKGPEDKDDEPEWQDAWDPESDTGIPLAVRVALQEDDDTVPLYMIARVHSEASQK